ncbi:uncharacterized protein BXZ73DRAFT_79296 [Epithele typhae]|uniref:uncharacterized protein n=1 Tax=Epithele typhae TaxID=378194 RepID=UPI00200820CA|nr:uncharacterized protein BXZ73DRAFT_79296 [Epithele typhae]KAH9924332.1 hypothetical protein BXZ73DRAFT_79296 [Epithele typhae]
MHAAINISILGAASTMSCTCLRAALQGQRFRRHCHQPRFQYSEASVPDSLTSFSVPFASASASALASSPTVHTQEARVRVKHYALGTSFTVLLFLGRIPDEPSACARDVSSASKRVVSGTVHLNDAPVRSGRVRSFESGEVLSVLREGLQWWVWGDGPPVPPSAVDELTAEVVATPPAGRSPTNRASVGSRVREITSGSLTFAMLRSMSTRASNQSLGAESAHRLLAVLHDLLTALTKRLPLCERDDVQVPILHVSPGLDDLPPEGLRDLVITVAVLPQVSQKGVPAREHRPAPVHHPSTVLGMIVRPMFRERGESAWREGDAEAGEASAVLLEVNAEVPAELRDASERRSEGGEREGARLGVGRGFAEFSIRWEELNGAVLGDTGHEGKGKMEEEEEKGMRKRTVCRWERKETANRKEGWKRRVFRKARDGRVTGYEDRCKGESKQIPTKTVSTEQILLGNLFRTVWASVAGGSLVSLWLAVRV